MSETARPIIVFDAVCVFCCANAGFVLRHDRRGHFTIASMQGETGRALYERFGIDPADPDTLIVVEKNTALRDSDAILAIYRELGWPWRAAAAFTILPRGLRDALYRWIARHRYRLFGRRQTCWLPDSDHADRVL
jgi:predicted DCC family thiol-disulfide oxidoreductase YuxK